MSFWVFMICILIAIFEGAVIDRIAYISKKEKEVEQKETEYEYYNVTFDEKETADDLVTLLKGIFDVNKILRVYDIYLASGVDASLEDATYGWDRMPQFEIVQHENLWMVKVPQPRLLVEK